MKKYKNKRRNVSKSALIVALIVALIGISYFLVRAHDNKTKITSPTSQPAADVNYSPPTQAEKDQVNNKVNTPIPSSSNSSNTSSNQVSFTVSQEKPGSQLVITTKLTGNGWGKCLLTLSQSGQTSISITADSIYQTSFSSCLGFSISMSQLPVGGSWTIDLSATLNTGAKVSATSQIFGVQK